MSEDELLGWLRLTMQTNSGLTAQPNRTQEEK